MDYIEHVRRLLAQHPCGLLTDIDGTISPIAATPDAAQVSPIARKQLHILSQHIDLVGAISGRAAADAAKMVGLPDLLYIGNHGMEVWQHGIAAPIPEAEQYTETIKTLLQKAEAQIVIPGVLFENKGVTASVHYRLAPDPQLTGAQIGTVLQKLTTEYGLRLTEGRLVWELRPPLDINKGTAIRRLVEQHQLRGIIFLGDDRTDADAFTVLRDIRAETGCVTLNVGIMAAETPAIVRELADVLVDGVAGTERFLSDVVEIVTSH
jgi:trehalose 6-phosphate phosphatase